MGLPQYSESCVLCSKCDGSAFGTARLTNALSCEDYGVYSCDFDVRACVLDGFSLIYPISLFRSLIFCNYVRICSYCGKCRKCLNRYCFVPGYLYG